jgi:hypothetical protein
LWANTMVPWRPNTGRGSMVFGSILESSWLVIVKRGDGQRARHHADENKLSPVVSDRSPAFSLVRVLSEMRRTFPKHCQNMVLSYSRLIPLLSQSAIDHAVVPCETVQGKYRLIPIAANAFSGTKFLKM